jgi:hypothetical protein
MGKHRMLRERIWTSWVRKDAIRETNCEQVVHGTQKYDHWTWETQRPENVVDTTLNIETRKRQTLNGELRIKNHQDRKSRIRKHTELWTIGQENDGLINTRLRPIAFRKLAEWNTEFRIIWYAIRDEKHWLGLVNRSFKNVWDCNRLWIPKGMKLIAQAKLVS